MTEVKVFRVIGEMLISHDKLPRWQKFVKDVRATKPSEAIELVYSLLGSNHKVKRRHIKIHEVKEIPVEETKSLQILALHKLDRIVVSYVPKPTRRITR
ncbi:MAG TPA: 50S ribosomal protein L18a [Desulfurococcales archaeon]|nr:50S ribosomal protein L18a [Desulfurococcales archaeon]